MLTVKQLREKIATLPDDMQVRSLNMDQYGYADYTNDIEIMVEDVCIAERVTAKYTGIRGVFLYITGKDEV